MKTTQAVRDIRKAGTKRVKSIVDDYGNRVHVVKKKNGETKIRSAGGIYGAKKRRAKTIAKFVKLGMGNKQEVKSDYSIIRRDSLTKKQSTGATRAKKNIAMSKLAETLPYNNQPFPREHNVKKDIAKYKRLRSMFPIRNKKPNYKLRDGTA